MIKINEIKKIEPYIKEYFNKKQKNVFRSNLRDFVQWSHGKANPFDWNSDRQGNNKVKNFLAFMDICNNSCQFLAFTACLAF